MFFTSRGLFLGTNVTQDANPNSSQWLRPLYAVSMIDSNEPMEMLDTLNILDSEAYGAYATFNRRLINQWTNAFSRLVLAAKGTNTTDVSLTLESANLGNNPFIDATTNTKSVFSLSKDGAVKAAGSVTATNGLFVIAPTNANTSPLDAPQPVGLFGSMMLIGTTNTVTIGSSGTYYTLTNYNTVRTNGFISNKATGFLTNTVAGYYRITVYASMIGGNSDTMEGEVFLNETGREEIAVFGSYDNPARVRTMSSTGILYIPANTGISFRLNNRSDTDNISVWRGAITVGTP